MCPAVCMSFCLSFCLSVRVPTCLRKLEKVGNLSGQGKSGRGWEFFLEKSGKMKISDMAIEARSRIPIQLHALLT